MLAKKYRLPVQSAVGKKGKEMHFSHFLIKIFPSRLPYSRFGVVLKKGIAKKAVDRNRVRRTIFDAIRKMENATAVPNRDIIAIVGKAAPQLKREVLISEIQAAISAIIKSS